MYSRKSFIYIVLLTRYQLRLNRVNTTAACAKKYTKLKVMVEDAILDNTLPYSITMVLRRDEGVSVYGLPHTTCCRPFYIPCGAQVILALIDYPCQKDETQMSTYNVM